MNIDDNENDVLEWIISRIDDSINLLNPKLKKWAEAHRIKPRPIHVSIDSDNFTPLLVWLVTDDIGHEDPVYRVVYDIEMNEFGLTCRLMSGIEYFMGIYGRFSEAVEGM